jgi:nucleotide-binding universal stress UspA family protein
MQADPGDEAAGWQAIDDQIRAQAAEVLDQLGVKWTFQVSTGDPAAELEATAASRKGDLIVVGSRGHTVSRIRPVAISTGPTASMTTSRPRSW